MHGSSRLRNSARAALEQAGFVVIAAEDLQATCDAVRSAFAAPVVALLEHVIGEGMTPWQQAGGVLPRGTAVLGLVEMVGPGDTPEATIVTRGEREIHGPMPVAELAVVLSWVAPACKNCAAPQRRLGARRLWA
jgi:hypothetical protein